MRIINIVSIHPCPGRSASLEAGPRSGRGAPGTWISTYYAYYYY